MNKLFIIGAMALVIATSFGADAARAQWHNRYNNHYNRGGVVSNALESMARTARRVERAVSGRNNYGYGYGNGNGYGYNNRGFGNNGGCGPQPVILVPVQQRPVRRGFGGYW